MEADKLLRQAVPLLPHAIGRPIKHRGPVQALAFNPDGTRPGTASWDGTAGIWQAAKGQQALALGAPIQLLLKLAID